jgi:hypothetical protein
MTIAEELRPVAKLMKIAATPTTPALVSTQH